MKSINDFFGNAYILAGALKSILAILLILQVISVLLGGAFVSDYAAFSLILGFIELGLFAGSILMIIINLFKSESKYIKGYLIGLAAIGLEFIFSGILLIFLVFFQCVMLLKAGTLIKTSGLDEKEIKNIKNTEWFYEDK